MKTLNFTKMHGLGNDFMVIDAVRQNISITPKQVQTWSQRHTGIGFDQCLIVEKSQQPGIDFFYRIFNANGQEVGQCGNGARCLGRFLQRQGLTTSEHITIATATTQMQLHLNADDTVSVNLGTPHFNPESLPFNASKKQSIYYLPYKDTVGSHESMLSFHIVSVGNPHAVILVDQIDTAPVDSVGAYISHHPAFPQQTNVGFMQIINPHTIHLRVYERGCGETQACGSGAAAAMAIGRRYHQLATAVDVTLLGGHLRVNWSGPLAVASSHDDELPQATREIPAWSSALQLTGPATFVYDGTLPLEFV